MSGNPHYDDFVQEGPFEMSGDDLRTLDNNNAMAYDGMNLLVLFC